MRKIIANFYHEPTSTESSSIGAISVTKPCLDHSTCISERARPRPKYSDLDPSSMLVPPSVPPDNFPLTVKVASKTRCSLECTCACHKSSATRTPRFLNCILGSVFLGYRAAPCFEQACNGPQCRTGAVQISYTYSFPAWFMKRILQASLTYNQTQGPELILRVMRVRALDEAPFCFINTFPNSIFTFGQVKAAIENADASVLDVSPNGSTILECVVSAMVYDLVEYLLKKGADPYFQAENRT